MYISPLATFLTGSSAELGTSRFLPFGGIVFYFLQKKNKYWLNSEVIVFFFYNDVIDLLIENVLKNNKGKVKVIIL